MTPLRLILRECLVQSLWLPLIYLAVCAVTPARAQSPLEPTPGPSRFEVPSERQMFIDPSPAPEETQRVLIPVRHFQVTCWVDESGVERWTASTDRQNVTKREYLEACRLFARLAGIPQPPNPEPPPKRIPVPVAAP